VGHRDDMQMIMPAMLLHEGIWEGDYQTVNMEGEIIDRHRAQVECIFPDDGPFAYYQKNHFYWEDGKEVRLEFGGELQGERLYWDTDRFSGFGWATYNNVVMLSLDRKDEPGASFFEVIIIGSDHKHRVRTWHWFKDGAPYQRTLCNERLIR
jgi:hypothetical protein